MVNSKALLAAATLSVSTSGLAESTEQKITQGYRTNAVMAQYYRWYQVYERPAGGHANATDLLTNDVTVTSGLGKATGHQAYIDGISKFPETWSNAHHVQSVNVEHREDGAQLKAHVLYQNLGMLPEDALRQSNLDYLISFENTDTLLPKISSVEIQQSADSPEPNKQAYQDAYTNNRARSLVHYWFAIIEDPTRDPIPVKEILADEFSLNFASGKVTDYEGFTQWLTGPASQVVASTHTIANFTTTALCDDKITVEMDLDWLGILPNQQWMSAKTRHIWLIENTVSERFARIKSMDIEILEAFKPYEEKKK